MEVGYIYCGRCGALVDVSIKDGAADCNQVYCINCIGELKEELLERNVCSLCRYRIDKQDIKFVMPSRLYSNYFFDRLPVENRLMCAECHKNTEKLQMVKIPFVKLGHIRAKLTKAIKERPIASVDMIKR